MIRLQFMNKTACEDNKKCFHCGAGLDHLALLNPRGESRGGVDGFYFRCDQCKRYFVEYRIGGKVKMVRDS